MTWQVWDPAKGERSSATKIEAHSAGEAAVNWVERNEGVVAPESLSVLVVNVVERGPDNHSTWRVTGEPRYYYKATFSGGHP